MQLEDRNLYHVRLNGTPEEAEEYLSQLLNSGWRVTEDSTYVNRNPAWSGNHPTTRTVKLLRDVPAPKGLEFVVYPDSQRQKYYAEKYPGHGAFVSICVRIDRRGGDPLGVSSGEVSAWLGVIGDQNCLCCALLPLPVEYSDDSFFGLLASFDEYGMKKRADFARSQSDREERAKNYSEIAHAAKDKCDPRRNPESSLPYVVACCHYWAAAGGLESVNQRSYYKTSFRKLTGREFDPAVDLITLSEVESLPSPTPLTTEELEILSRPPLYECLECGFQTEKAELIESGAMGCVRCN